MKVKLKCQWDNGELVLPPGSETELDRDQALALADMGMVEIMPEETPAKPVKPSTATKAAAKAKPKKPKAAAAKPKNEPAPAPEADESAIVDDGSDNDSENLDNENQDPKNDLADPENEIPDPDSLVE